MIYNNLLYLITVIIIFSTGGVPDAPQIPFTAALIIFLAKGGAYHYLVRRAHSNGRAADDKHYFATEQKFSLLAIFIFAIDVYLLDIKYYFSFLSLNGNLPVLLSLGGISLFFFYLSLLWLAARKNYQGIFGRHYSAKEFVINNIKLNIPIILPWLIINFIADFLKILPFPLSKMLALHPDITFSQPKEPQFFSHKSNWRKRIEEYHSNFKIENLYYGSLVLANSYIYFSNSLLNNID